ncbi:hypothetical protein RI528_00180 [Aeromonas veronii]|uniref:hypothetical protein n=1 Tax=Aeromonas TaxID=642 RepID=UPI00343B5C80
MRTQDFMAQPDPATHDGIELWGMVNQLPASNDDTAFAVVTDPQIRPEMWTVFLRLKEGGAEDLLDCLSPEEARETAAELASLYGWGVIDKIFA